MLIKFITAQTTDSGYCAAFVSVRKPHTRFNIDSDENLVITFS